MLRRGFSRLLRRARRKTGCRFQENFRHAAKRHLKEYIAQKEWIYPITPAMETRH